MEGTSLSVSLMSEPPKKLPMPTPKVVSGKAGDVLVGAERDGQEAVEQAHQQASPTGEQSIGMPMARKRVHVRRRDGLLIEERADDAADAADVHDAGNAEVQVAGFLRQDLARAAVAAAGCPA